MTWIKLDDQAVDHPKIAGLSDRAFRWWVRGLSYASRFLTDGHLPFVFVKQAPKAAVSELLNHRLWEACSDHDEEYQIHDYLHHQTRKEDVEHEKARNRDKAAAYRDRKRKELVTGNTGGNVTGTALPKSDRVVPNPENREQIQIQRTEQASAGSVRGAPTLVGSSMQWHREHGSHVEGFCTFVCFPRSLWDEFVTRVEGAGFVNPEQRVLDWANKVRNDWQAEGRIVGDSRFDFWKNEWLKVHGSNRPSTGVDVTAGLRGA